MPKPIKKRAVRKGKVEEEAKTYLEHAHSFYSTRRRQIQIIAAALLVVIAAGVGAILYLRNTASRAEALQQGAYALYLSASFQNDPARLREALAKFQDAYGVKKSPLILYYEADIYERTGDIKNAVTTLETLIQSYPSDRNLLPLSYTKLGMLYVQQKEYEKALATFGKLAKSDLPFYRDLALYEEGTLYRKMGKEEEAQKAFDTLKSMFPNSPFAKIQGGQEKAEQGNQQGVTEPKAK